MSEWRGKAEGARHQVRQASGITWRSVGLGLLLAGALNAVTPYNDYGLGNTYVAGNHFPIGAVFVLLGLSLANFLARRRRGRSLLERREVAVVYIIIMVTSGIPSSGLLRYMIPCGTVPYYFAGRGNQWQDLFWEHIRPWMAVSDPEAVNWFWEGLPEGAGIPWLPWVGMMAHWFVFFGALWVMMICAAALVRKQWADRERLAFPLVQFPLEVLREEQGPHGSFFTNRLVWIGGGAVFLVHVINGLHRYFPAVPGIPTFFELDQSFPDRPWNAITPVYLGIFFSAIAFGYLLSLEVAASFWASVWFIKIQGIALSALGYEGGSAWGGVISEISDGEQMGGLLALAFVLLWLLRGTFKQAFRRAFTSAREADDSGEPIGYRWAVYGLLAAAAVAFGWLVAAGMTAGYAALFLVFFGCICLVLTRIIAEAGMLMIHLSFWPVDYLLMLGGSPAMGPGNLTALTFVDCSLTFDLREFLMPSALNGFRLAEQSGVPTRKLVPVVAAALLFSVLVSVPAFLYACYKPGATQIGNVVELWSHPLRFFGRLADRLQNPVYPTTTQYVAMAAGAALVLLLSWLRISFVWWPVHPLGFVMATSWASLNLWFSLFVGWVCKLLTIRYTGLRGYVALRPLFMGIILGDVMGAVLWMVVGWFTHVGFMVTVN